MNERGGSWWLIDSSCDVLSNECGIWFNVANPLSIAPPGAAGEQNLWYALIDRTCRVRVTAVIESDQRVEAQAIGRSAPTVFRNSSVLYAPDRFRFLRRLDSAGGGGGSDGVETTPDRDDTGRMNDVAESLAASRGSQAVTARPVVPWLDTFYEAGDRIVGVRGRGIRFCAERVPSRRHPCVIGKRYRFDGGRFETELVLASIVGGDADTGI